MSRIEMKVIIAISIFGGTYIFFDECMNMVLAMVVNCLHVSVHTHSVWIINRY